MTPEISVRTLLLTLLAGCGSAELPPPDPVVDGSFDLWCGRTLCGWEVEQGSVRKVSTWSPYDSGASLQGDPVVLSQVFVEGPAITSWLPDWPVAAPPGGFRPMLPSARCLDLTVVDDVEDRASLAVSLDLQDDGTPDWTFAVPSSRYEPRTTEFALPHWFSSVRMRITKTGSGRAVLGRIALDYAPRTRPCANELTLDDLQAGTPCADAASCAGGLCEDAPGSAWGDSCATCASDADCGGGQVCGSAPALSPDQWPYAACVDPGTRALGESCRVDQECGSGVCCEGQCSECCASAPCADGAECVVHPSSGGPRRCADGPRPSGDACFADEDCASGRCEGTGTVSICDDDGRTCASDADCPSWFDHCDLEGPWDGICR